MLMMPSMTQVLLWSSVINLAILLVWFAVFTLGRDFVFRNHARWFRLNAEQFDTLHYCGMGIYKLLILVFNVVPLLALWLAK